MGSAGGNRPKSIPITSETVWTMRTKYFNRFQESENQPRLFGYFFGDEKSIGDKSTPTVANLYLEISRTN
ncbi:hypothetical protein [Croceivirga lutea]|uniref:hypothetical protein n=1 Tax=Croceivirga lutea TaxID=1775167 RepID=UPI00163B5062|nr:hypothetical protein [Croceivirga lutea]